MPDNIYTIQKTVRSRLPALRGWFPLFPIWALQWIASAFIEYAGEWRFPSFTQQATVWAAVLLSAALVLYRAPDPSESGKGDRSSFGGWKTAAWVSIPFLIAAGSSVLLVYIYSVDPFFMGLFRSLLLSFLYALLGVFLGRELVLLGLWLFALCLVTGIWYLGFTPIVLDLMGGFSLGACGWMLHRWSREALSR